MKNTIKTINVENGYNNLLAIERAENVIIALENREIREIEAISRVEDLIIELENMDLDDELKTINIYSLKSFSCAISIKFIERIINRMKSGEFNIDNDDDLRDYEDYLNLRELRDIAI